MLYANETGGVEEYRFLQLFKGKNSVITGIRLYAAIQELDFRIQLPADWDLEELFYLAV